MVKNQRDDLSLEKETEKSKESKKIEDDEVTLSIDLENALSRIKSKLF